jgi:hypothetical protein
MYLLISPRVKHFGPNKKREIVDTDEEENLVGPLIEWSIIVAVELHWLAISTLYHYLLPQIEET